MATVKEQIKSHFPQVADASPELPDDVVEYLIEHAVELDESAGAGWHHLGQVVNGVVPLAMLREAVETCMCREAGHMLDAMRGVVVAKALDGLNEDDITHYFKIRAAYVGLSDAGML